MSALDDVLAAAAGYRDAVLAYDAAYRDRQNAILAAQPDEDTAHLDPLVDHLEDAIDKALRRLASSAMSIAPASPLTSPAYRPRTPHLRLADAQHAFDVWPILAAGPWSVGTRRALLEASGAMARAIRMMRDDIAKAGQ